MTENIGQKREADTMELLSLNERRRHNCRAFVDLILILNHMDQMFWLAGITLLAATINGALGYGFSSITVPLALAVPVEPGAQPGAGDHRSAAQRLRAVGESCGASRRVAARLSDDRRAGARRRRRDADRVAGESRLAEALHVHRPAAADLVAGGRRPAADSGGTIGGTDLRRRGSASYIP